MYVHKIKIPNSPRVFLLNVAAAFDSAEHIFLKGWDRKELDSGALWSSVY